MKYVVVCSRLDTMVAKRKILLEKMIEAGASVYVVAMEDHEGTQRYLADAGIGHMVIKCVRNRIGLFSDLLYCGRLLRLFRKIRPNVVVTYTIKPSIYTGMVLRCCGPKVRFYPVVTGLGFAFQGGSWLRVMLKMMVIRLYRLAFKRATYVILQNETNRKLFCDLDITDVCHSMVIAGDGVEVPAHVVGPSSPRKRFVTIARLLGEKGLRELHEAVLIVKQEHPWFDVQLYGPFESSPDAVSRAEIEQWQSEKTLVWRGYCSDVSEVLTRADAFVLPSYHEGMCTAVCEAIAHGLPVVGTDIPGIREMVSGNGVLVPPKTVVPLAAAMKSMLSRREEEWVRMSALSREIAKNQFERKMLMNRLYEVVI